MTLQTSAMTNNNLFEATGGGILAISGITVTQGASGQITAAGAGSKVNLTGGATISGGTLSTSAGGVIQNSSGTNTIGSLTNSGTLQYSRRHHAQRNRRPDRQRHDHRQQQQQAFATVFSFGGGTLSGTGSVTLNGIGANAQLNGTLTQAAGHTIQGLGQINAALTNNGTVNANVNAGTLTLQTSAMTNNNLFEATSGGILAISGITVTQGASGQITRRPAPAAKSISPEARRSPAARSARRPAE